VLSHPARIAIDGKAGNSRCKASARPQRTCCFRRLDLEFGVVGRQNGKLAGARRGRQLKCCVAACWVRLATPQDADVRWEDGGDQLDTGRLNAQSLDSGSWHVGTDMRETACRRQNGGPFVDM